MKMFRKCSVLLLAAALGCTAAFSTGCGENNSVFNPDTDAADSGISIYAPEVPDSRVDENTPGSSQNAGIGETVNYNDKVSVTLDRVIEVDDVDKTTYRVLLAEMTITNNSDEKIDCSTITHFSTNIDNSESAGPVRDVQASVAARKYYTATSSTLQAFNQEIKAGETVSGYVSIYAPTAWTSMELIYTPYKYYNTDRVIFFIDEGKLTHYSEKLS